MEYWNHNAAYHPWLIDIAREVHGDVLDIGCGEGLALQRLAPWSRSVLGLDLDSDAVARARRRLAEAGWGGERASAAVGNFRDVDLGERRFDLIVFVASLHHMDTAAALIKARGLLRPGGQIAVVGLARNRGILDWVISGLKLPIVRVASRLHANRSDAGVRVADPAESLRDIRRIARQVLPGAQLRRGLYYRYLLRWRDSRQLRGVGDVAGGASVGGAA